MFVRVGQPILAAAAFQAAFLDTVWVFAPGEGRLKAGCSQNWLPHMSRDSKI